MKANDANEIMTGKSGASHAAAAAAADGSDEREEERNSSTEFANASGGERLELIMQPVLKSEVLAHNRSFRQSLRASARARVRPNLCV